MAPPSLEKKSATLDSPQVAFPPQSDLSQAALIVVRQQLLPYTQRLP
jgi:hypothetical protein